VSAKSHASLVQLGVGFLNNRGERFALLAGEVCKGSAGKARELNGKGVDALSEIAGLGSDDEVAS